MGANMSSRSSDDQEDLDRSGLVDVETFIRDTANQADSPEYAGSTPVYHADFNSAEELASDLNTSRQANPSSPSDSDGYDTDSATLRMSSTALNIVRLIRSTAAGRRLLSADDSTSDSEDDPDYTMSMSMNKRKQPIRNYQPDTSKMNANDIRLLTEHQPQFSPDKSVCRALQQRSIGRQKKKRLTNNMIPTQRTTLEKFRNKVFCGVYGRDGDIFVSACQDRMIRIYDTRGGNNFRLLQNFQAKDVGWSVLDVALSPDGHHVVYSSWNNFLYQVRILDAAHCPTYKPKVIREKTDVEREQRQGQDVHQTALCLDPQENQQHQFCIFSLRFSSDSKEILGGANDGRIYVYDRETNQQGLSISAHHHADVNAVCFMDETTQILASGSDDGLVKVWDRRELKEGRPTPVGQLAGHRDGIAYLDPRGDGRYLISNSKDQSIKLWDIRKFTPKSDINKFVSEVRRQHWDYRWESVPRRMKHEKKAIDGDSSVMTYKGHSVLQTLIRAHFSPAHSTGQKYIYTGCANGRVVIYDLLTGKILEELDGHMSCVRDVSWHPYYPCLISSSWDATICRWDYTSAYSDIYQSDEEFENEEMDCGRKRKNPKRNSKV